ncbi:MAG: hypothetical protein JJU36_08625, partial [Phycisphaeraceae bacterium]|nr:hypothetical protein [Phycisphaeraceae bacterium]
MKKRRLFAGLALAGLLAGGTSAFAIETVWTGLGDGVTWTDLDNWSDGAPGVLDTARFNAAAAVTLDLDQTIDSLLFQSGAVTVGGTNTLSLNSIVQNNNQTRTFDADISDILAGGLSVAVNSNTLVINGLMALGGELTKTGGATLALTNADSSAAGVNLSGGTLSLRNNSVFDWTDLGIFTVVGNSTLDVRRVSANDNQTHTIAGVNLGATLTVSNANNHRIDLGGVTLTADAGINANITAGDGVTISGGLSGDFDFTRGGSGVLTITSVGSTRVQDDIINGGTTHLNVADALGTGTLVVNGGTVNVNATQGLSAWTLGDGRVNLNVDGAIDGSASVIVDGGLVHQGVTGGQSAYATTTVNAGGAIGGDWTGATIVAGAPGAGEIGLANGAIVVAGTVNAPGAGFGSDLLLGINSNNQTFVQDGDPYVGLAFGAWTPSGNFTNGALTSALADGGDGEDLNITLYSSKNFRAGSSGGPSATLNSETGIVNVTLTGNFNLGFESNGASPATVGDWDTLNVIGLESSQNTNIFTANRSGAVQAGKTINVTDGRVNLSNNDDAVLGTINIGDGATLFPTRNASTGTFNILEGGALFIDNAARLTNGATFTNEAGSLLVLRGNITLSASQLPQSLVDNADIILDRNTITLSDGIIIRDGYRITTGRNQNAALGGDGVVAMEDGAILSAPGGRTLTINNNVSGVTLQLGDASPFTTTIGDNNMTRDTLDQTGTVTLGGVVTANDVVLVSGNANITNGSSTVAGDVDVQSGVLSAPAGIFASGTTTTVAAGAVMEFRNGTFAGDIVSDGTVRAPNGWDGTLNLEGSVTLNSTGQLRVPDNRNYTINIEGTYTDLPGARIFAPVSTQSAGVYWANNQTNEVNADFQTATQRNNWTVGAKGPDTVVNYAGGGVVAGGGFANNQAFWIRLEDGATWNMTSAASWGGVPSSNGSALRFVSDTTGTVELEAGFDGSRMGTTADGYGGAGGGAGGVRLLGGITLITNDSGNLPSGFVDSSFGDGFRSYTYLAFDSTGGSTWQVRSNSQEMPNSINVWWDGTIDVAGGLSLTQTGTTADSLDSSGITINPNRTLTRTGDGALVAGGFVSLGTTVPDPDTGIREYTSAIDMAKGIMVFLDGSTITTIDNTGADELNPGTASLTAADFATIRGLVLDAHFAGYANTTGIMSSAAFADSSLAIGYASGSQISSVGGVALGADDVVIRVTKKGDATLDGTVDINDASVLLGNFGATSGKTWAEGDFTGDGAVNIDDASALLGNFGASYSPAAGEIEVTIDIANKQVIIEANQVALIRLEDPSGNIISYDPAVPFSTVNPVTPTLVGEFMLGNFITGT